MAEEVDTGELLTELPLVERFKNERAKIDKAGPI